MGEEMSGWFTTWTFWFGAIWGGSVGWLALWYSLVLPMHRELVARRYREGEYG